jgi:tetratricopeptide (TPR) repeat protein
MGKLPSYPKEAAIAAAPIRKGKGTMKQYKRIGLVLFFASAFAAAVPAQDPSVLLEQAIYAEETLGDLNQAIGIYQQIVADADAGRPTAAQALFRLGMCYQKSGHNESAQAAFSRLKRLYPEQKELIAGIPAFPSEAPSLGPAPWVDGEILQFTMKTKGSAAGIGATQVFSMESLVEEGNTGWRFRSIQAMPGTSMFSIISTDSGYAPIERRNGIRRQGMENHLIYAGDHVEVSTVRGGTEKTTRYPLARDAFDEEQLYMLLRCLPLGEGFQTTLPFLKQSDGSIYDLEVRVTGREKVTVPAGVFDCFVIMTKTAAVEQTCWISSDSPFYIVKMNATNAVDLELSSISRIEKSSPVVYESSEPGISLSAPPGWIISASDMMTAKLVNIIDPEGKSECYLATGQNTGNDDPREALPQLVDQMIKMYQSQYKDYEVRPGSRENTTISGTMVTRFIADHKTLIGGQDSVQYVFYFATADGIGQLYFQTDRGNFDRMQPVFDSIAYSVQMH